MNGTIRSQASDRSPQRQVWFAYRFTGDEAEIDLNQHDEVVFDGNSRRVFEVHGGFADVTPAGLTILAEQASEVTA